MQLLPPLPSSPPVLSPQSQSLSQMQEQQLWQPPQIQSGQQEQQLWQPPQVSALACGLYEADGNEAADAVREARFDDGASDYEYEQNEAEAARRRELALQVREL